LNLPQVFRLFYIIKYTTLRLNIFSMKQTISLAIVMMLTIGAVFAKDKQRISPHTTIKNGNISITYGQPSKKGRVIFGNAQAKALVPYGEVWRAGADEATEITFSKDCIIEGRPLKAGTYTLFVRPGANEWQIILNSKLGQWGSFGYEKVKDQNVLVFPIAAKHVDNVVETFTITINNDGVLMEWDKVSALIPVEFKN
jgi:hypothetical protein